MTVKELIGDLLEMPKDAVVLVAPLDDEKENLFADSVVATKPYSFAQESVLIYTTE